MKRIAITIAALAISSTAFAGVSDNYGDVMQDQVAASSSYSSPSTWLDNHGNVTLDNTSRNQGLPRAIERGLPAEISIGDSDNLFEVDADDSF
jgi:hypothetical protein